MFCHTTTNLQVRNLFENDEWFILHQFWYIPITLILFCVLRNFEPQKTVANIPLQYLFFSDPCTYSVICFIQNRKSTTGDYLYFVRNILIYSLVIATFVIVSIPINTKFHCLIILYHPCFSFTAPTGLDILQYIKTDINIFGPITRNISRQTLIYLDQ